MATTPRTAVRNLNDGGTECTASVGGEQKGLVVHREGKVLAAIETDFDFLPAVDTEVLAIRAKTDLDLVDRDRHIEPLIVDPQPPTV